MAVSVRSFRRLILPFCKDEGRESVSVKEYYKCSSGMLGFRVYS